MNVRCTDVKVQMLAGIGTHVIEVTSCGIFWLCDKFKVRSKCPVQFKFEISSYVFYMLEEHMNSAIDIWSKVYCSMTGILPEESGVEQDLED